MNLKEKLDNIFEFNDGEMTIHLNDTESITVPSHVFVNSVMDKLEDYLIFAPFNGKNINWINSEHLAFIYADPDTYWVDIDFNLKQRDAFKYNANLFKIARYYPYKPKSSKVSIHGRMVSREVAKQLIYDRSSNIKRDQKELDYLLERLK